MEIIDQIRQVANIVELASQYTTLRQRGRKHVGLCPFHAEKTPSFTVDAEKGLFHCFGCGVGGDVFSLVMEKENLSFPEALEIPGRKISHPSPRAKEDLSPGAQTRGADPEDQRIRPGLFPEEPPQHPGRKESPGIPQKARDLREVIQDFKLGYALNTWDSLFRIFKNKGVSAGLLEKAGLVLPGKKPGEFYDRFRGRVIFPIFSLTGKVVGFGGRTLFNADPKYLNSPDTPVYSKGHLLYGLNFTQGCHPDRRRSHPRRRLHGFPLPVSVRLHQRRRLPGNGPHPPSGRSGPPVRPEDHHQL